MRFWRVAAGFFYREMNDGELHAGIVLTWCSGGKPWCNKSRCFSRGVDYNGNSEVVWYGLQKRCG
jgi:hypothetical protein